MFIQGGKEAKGLIEFLPEKEGSPRPWGPALEEGQGLSPYLCRPPAQPTKWTVLKIVRALLSCCVLKKPVANNLGIIAWFRYPGTHQCLLF